MLSTLDNTAKPSFKDWGPIKVIAQRNPQVFTEWTLRRECAAAEFNGLIAAGAAVKYKGKWLLNEPKLLTWWEKRYGLKSA